MYTIAHYIAAITIDWAWYNVHMYITWVNCKCEKSEIDRDVFENNSESKQ